MKARAQRMQMRERALHEGRHGTLRDRREDDVAQFVERIAEQAQRGIGQHQEDRHRDRRAGHRGGAGGYRGDIVDHQLQH